MAIYQLFEEEKTQQFTETFDQIDAGLDEKKGARLFSTLVTRFCFFLLLIADVAWLIYNMGMVCIASFAYLVTGGKNLHIHNILRKYLLHFRRSAVCALALLAGLFSPPFGIMVACTYFLMYDKSGMEEVVPASLQGQIKDIFRTEP